MSSALLLQRTGREGCEQSMGSLNAKLQELMYFGRGERHTNLSGDVHQCHAQFSESHCNYT